MASNLNQSELLCPAADEESRLLAFDYHCPRDEDTQLLHFIARPMGSPSIGYMTPIAVKADAIVTDAGRLGDTLIIEDGEVAEIGEGLVAEHGIEFDGVIVPGLRDAHFHPAPYTASRVQPVLKTAADFAEIGARLRAAADSIPAGTALVGLRLDDETLAEGRLPTRIDLDLMIPDRPVLLQRPHRHRQHPRPRPRRDRARHSGPGRWLARPAQRRTQRHPARNRRDTCGSGDGKAGGLFGNP